MYPDSNHDVRTYPIHSSTGPRGMTQQTSVCILYLSGYMYIIILSPINKMVNKYPCHRGSLNILQVVNLLFCEVGTHYQNMLTSTWCLAQEEGPGYPLLHSSLLTMRNSRGAHLPHHLSTSLCALANRNGPESSQGFSVLTLKYPANDMDPGRRTDQL